MGTGIALRIRSSRSRPRVAEAPRPVPWGRTGAADWRNLGDSQGQQGTMNVEASGRFATIHLGSETPGLRFHTAEATDRETLLTSLRPPSPGNQ
jgi:hypothetical protein